MAGVTILHLLFHALDWGLIYREDIVDVTYCH